MEQPQDGAKQKTERKIMPGRFALQFYNELKGIFQVDTEECYRRVVEQAKSAERRSRAR